MLGYDFLANKQSHSGSLILILPMQPFKGLEDQTRIFFIKSDAIVLNGYFPGPVASVETVNGNYWWFVGFAVFQAI